MTTISMATRCPGTKWISGILNLSLVRGAVLVGSGELGGGREGLPKAQLGPGTPAMGEKPLWIVFTTDPEEGYVAGKLNSREPK